MLSKESEAESCSLNSSDSIHSKNYDERNDEFNRLQLPLPSNILTRTSTIISAIRDDNKFAKLKTQPDLSFDPKTENIESSKLSLDQEIGNPEGKEEKPAVKDTGEYNKYDLEHVPPDGTFWGWMSAFCVLSINCFSWGGNSSFGVYLNYYVSTDYFPGARMEQYVMIGGLGLGFSFMVCTLANSLVRRYYYKIIMLVGTAIIFISYWLASISKTVVQLIMFQGFLLSIGYALAAGACFVILPTWFLKKRSLAQGIATAGAGLAGIIFSRPVDVLITNEGKKGVVWALRMQALVCGFMLVISIILIRCHRSLKVNSGKSLWKESTEFIYRTDLIRQLPMICIILWNMVYGVAYTILLFSLSSYASSIGLSYKQGSNITTVQSVSQCIGRPLLGICSDAIGRANTTIIFTFLLGIICFVYWIFIETYSELIGFAFVAGLIMGVNWVNFGPMTADIVGGGDDLLAAISILTFTGGMPLLVAELIGLKLRRYDMEKQFLYCQILVGVACLVSVALLMPFREWKIKRILKARRNLLRDELEQKNISSNYNFNAEGEEGEKIEEGKEAEEKKEREDNEENGEEDSNHIIEIQNTLQRLDWILETGIKSYIIRMFYPIAV